MLIPFIFLVPMARGRNAQPPHNQVFSAGLNRSHVA
jgi:hypothetical protein